MGSWKMMRLQIKPLYIPEIKNNEVTSHKVFQDRKMVNENGEFLFHEDGIFSHKIFGKFKQCNCEHNPIKMGICKVCNTRVLDKGNLPTFYIKFNNLRFPNYEIDAPTKVKQLLHYEAMIYDGEFIEIDLRNMDLTTIDESRMLIGKEAIYAYDDFYDEDWYYNNTSDKLVIPHTSMRPILKSPSGQYVLGQLNSLYVKLLQNKQRLDRFRELGEESRIVELTLKNKLLGYIKDIRTEIVMILTNGKKSVVAKELRGQKIIGNIRAVMINNYDVDEDEILIGKYFIPHLYPKLSKPFQLAEGGYDIAALNQKLKEEYTCLINRQPTISAKSILGAIPQFSDREIDKFVVQVNPIILDALSGDVDGDVLSILALYSKKANEEARKLLTSKNYIEGSNGSVRQCFPEDFVYAQQKK